MDAEQVMFAFNARKPKHNISFDLKKEQLQIAVSVANKRNCVAFLPTGYGKTLCFVVNAIINDAPCLVLVISPLVSLMDNQISTLKGWNLSCIRIGTDLTEEETAGIASGKYMFVFTSPESALKPKWRDIFLNEVWQSQLSLLVFDEAHCISEWGEDFRVEYKEMSQLRSFFKVPVIALTATCTPKVKTDILDSLQLSDSRTDVIHKSANRENIFIVCTKRQHRDNEVELNWLIDHLKLNGRNSKKIIVYCRSIDTVSDLFILVKRLLGDHAYADCVKQPENLLVEMYHKCTHDNSKTRIIQDFFSSQSTIRCLFATVALGMGIDIPDIDIVIHMGCPKSVISYWQEAGRCARDGRQGLSLIVYDNFTASLRNTDKSMANIVKECDTKCIRTLVLDNFSVSSEDRYKSSVCQGCIYLHCKCQACRCCAICAQLCPCYKKGFIDLSSFLSCRDWNEHSTCDNE